MGVIAGVTAAHALLLLGLPHWRSAGQPTLLAPVMVTRAMVEGAVQAAPAPSPAPAPQATRAERAKRTQPRSKPQPHQAVRDESPDAPTSQATETSPPVAATAGPAEASDRIPSFIEAPPGVVAGPANYSVAVTPVNSPLEDLVVSKTMQDAPSTRVVWPRPVRILYVASATVGEATGSAPATLNWRHDDHHFSVTWDMFAKVPGNRRSAAHGLLTEGGLAPVQSMEITDASRRETRFDYANRELINSDESARAAFEPGTQGALSLLVHLASVVAADPTRYQPGQSLGVKVLEGATISDYAFVVHPEETLVALQGKLVKAIHLVHGSLAPGQPNVQVWLAPSLDYMPVRWRTVSANGDALDQLAQNAYELTVPKSSR